MPRNYYNNYQYETSPRKLEPDYTPRKKTYPKKSTAIKPKKVEEKKKQVKTKTKIQVNKQKMKLVLSLAIGFVLLFTISYRNTKINESFKEVQTMKKQLSAIQKENEQLRVNIENSTNLTNLEQQAKTLLGMQKLANSQKIYVSLPKKDYVEPASEKVVIEEEKEESLFDRIINNILNIF